MTDDKEGIVLQRWSSQRSVTERLAALTDFIRYWHGTHTGEPEVAVGMVPDFLPAPLKWLYQTVAQFDTSALRSNVGGWIDTSGIIQFHWLKVPSHIELDECKHIEFLNENQGVSQWATTNQRDDPPVFRRYFDDTIWEPHAEHLTDFLLVLLVFELTYGSPNSAWGVFPANDFQDFVAPLVPVDIGRPARIGDDTTFVYHGTDLVVWSVVNRDGTQSVQLAARTSAALQPLKSLIKWDSWAVNGQIVIPDTQA